MLTATATCHNEGCAKNGEPVPGLPVSVTDPETGDERRVDVVLCGVCLSEITDVVDDG